MQSNTLFDNKVIPGEIPLVDLFSNPDEDIDHDHSSEEFHKFTLSIPITLHTRSEDNLIMRGRNIFGEKSWLDVVNRFFPGVGYKTIFHRHETLSCRILRGHGVNFNNADLETSSTKVAPGVLANNSLDILNESRYGLRLVAMPNNYELHRWSLEEDLMLMRAVNIVVSLMYLIDAIEHLYAHTHYSNALIRIERVFNGKS